MVGDEVNFTPNPTAAPLFCCPHTGPHGRPGWFLSRLPHLRCSPLLSAGNLLDQGRFQPCPPGPENFLSIASHRPGGVVGGQGGAGLAQFSQPCSDQSSETQSWRLSGWGGPLVHSLAWGHLACRDSRVTGSVTAVSGVQGGAHRPVIAGAGFSLSWNAQTGLSWPPAPVASSQAQREAQAGGPGAFQMDLVWVQLARQDGRRVWWCGSSMDSATCRPRWSCVIRGHGCLLAIVA